MPLSRAEVFELDMLRADYSRAVAEICRLTDENTELRRALRWVYADFTERDWEHFRHDEPEFHELVERLLSEGGE